MAFWESPLWSFGSTLVLQLPILPCQQQVMHLKAYFKVFKSGSTLERDDSTRKAQSSLADIADG